MLTSGAYYDLVADDSFDPQYIQSDSSATN
jgi:hypothetical protein